MIGQLPAHRKLECVSLTSPLGIRFLDVATNSVVADGLVVEAYVSARTGKRVAAVPNRSGVYAFHGLPGLRGFEYSSDDETRWSSVSFRQFTIEVVDQFARFVPCKFTTEAPLRVLDAKESPQGSGLRTVPLFSAPSRLVPGGLAVARSEIYEVPQGSPAAAEPSPAAWAVLELIVGTGPRAITMRGIADASGRVVVMFPYPEAEGVAPNSPPSGGPLLLSKQRWPARFRVWHLFDPTPAEFADLDRLLPLFDRQPEELWDGGPPISAFSDAEIIFGRELIVPSRDQGDLRPRKLFISPAASPP